MARQQYSIEKFKPTKGAFGGGSKFNQKLKLQASLREQLEKMELDKSKAETTTPEKDSSQEENVTDRTE